MLYPLTGSAPSERMYRTQACLSGLDSAIGARSLSVEMRVLLYCSISSVSCSELILLTKSSYVTVHAALRELVARRLIAVVKGEDDRRNVFYQQTPRVAELQRLLFELAEVYTVKS